MGCNETANEIGGAKDRRAEDDQLSMQQHLRQVEYLQTIIHSISLGICKVMDKVFGKEINPLPSDTGILTSVEQDLEI